MCVSCVRTGDINASLIDPESVFLLQKGEVIPCKIQVSSRCYIHVQHHSQQRRLTPVGVVKSTAIGYKTISESG